MASFPWDGLKAGTLRTICKDLGASPATKRKRADMISFLKQIENRGLTAALQESNSTTGGDTSINRHVAPPPIPTPFEESHEVDADVDMESDSTCACEDGWLSPRLKFVLSTTALVSSDIVIDTGATAKSARDVYLAEYIPSDRIPRGRQSLVPWIGGFATIFRAIHDMFEAGDIPTIDELENMLSQLPNDKRKLVKAYRIQGAEVESVIGALVHVAKEEWELGDFEATHCDDGNWDALPACAEHDVDWTLAKDMLVG